MKTFLLTYSAYMDLKRRNANSSERLERAQQFFVFGVALVFISVLAYIFTSYPPI